MNLATLEMRLSSTRQPALLDSSAMPLPVLLIHGHTLDARMWHAQIAALEGQFEVIAPTLRGYGDSVQPEGACSHADDLIALLEARGAARVHIAGLSLGGNIALEIAVRFPERVATLALLDSSLKGFAPDAAQLEIGHAVQRAFESGGLEPARAAWLSAPLFAAARENAAMRQQLEAWVAGYSGWHWTRSVSPSAQIPDLSQRLSEVTAPTLIAVGKRDTAYSHSVAHALHAGIANSRLEVIAGAGHMVNLERPKMVNALLLEHFGRGG